MRVVAAAASFSSLLPVIAGSAVNQTCTAAIARIALQTRITLRLRCTVFMLLHNAMVAHNPGRRSHCELDGDIAVLH